MAKTNALTAALEKASQDVYRNSIKAALAELGPKVSIGEVVDSLQGTPYEEPFWSVTLGEIQEAVGGRSAPARKAAGSTAPATKRKSSGSGKVWYTRTDEGREGIDAAMAEFLQAQSEPVGAEDIRASLGGTSAQIRQSLARLIGAKQATKKGQKRATKYAWKGR